MQGISLDVIRVGKNYRITNYDDVCEFQVLNRISDNNFALKDLHTLEKYDLLSLISFGKGEDFEVEEL